MPINYPFARTIRTRCLIYPVFAYDLPVGDNGTGETGYNSPSITGYPVGLSPVLAGNPFSFYCPPKSVLVSQTLDTPGKTTECVGSHAWCGGCRMYAFHLYVWGIYMLPSPHLRVFCPRGSHDVRPWLLDGSFSTMASDEVSTDGFITFPDGCFRLLIPATGGRAVIPRS